MRSRARRNGQNDHDASGRDSVERRRISRDRSGDQGRGRSSARSRRRDRNRHGGDVARTIPRAVDAANSSSSSSLSAPGRSAARSRMDCGVVANVSGRDVCIADLLPRCATSSCSSCLTSVILDTYSDLASGVSNSASRPQVAPIRPSACQREPSDQGLCPISGVPAKP